jgi:hypothetical protein
MAISSCPLRRLAAVAIALTAALTTHPALAQSATRAPAPAAGMLPVGRQADYDFSVDARSLVRRGDLVTFQLAAVNAWRRDRYDARIEVDCAQRTRRELEGTSDDGHGNVHRNDGETGTHAVLEHTRADIEFKVVCGRAVAAAATPVPSARAKLHPSAVAPAADLADAGMDATANYTIFIDSIHHKGQITSYLLQARAPDATWATREHYVVDCQRKLRAFEPDDSASGARLNATRVVPDSREARELATACAMPDGPRSRWFAGFVVTPDGVVVAPHMRTYGCASYSTGVGAQRRTLQFIADEEDVTLLKLTAGGDWAVMPATDAPPSAGPQPVTMMGVSGVEPRVSAAWALKAGANRQDTGWPQVYTRSDRVLREGLVWNASGAAIGVAVAPQGHDATHAYVRMLPAGAIRGHLARHGWTWPGTDGHPRDAEAAMRLALAATVPIVCEHAP